jgi:Putative nucleotidyltransferase substrate binding domain
LAPAALPRADRRALEAAVRTVKRWQSRASYHYLVTD